jgi:hypothetical protein
LSPIISLPNSKPKVQHQEARKRRRSQGFYLPVPAFKSRQKSNPAKNYSQYNLKLIFLKIMAQYLA